MSRRSRDDAPVLLPTAHAPRSPLPAGLSLLGVLGLVILLSSTLPSVRQHVGLLQAHGRLQGEVDEAAARTEALRQELRAAAQESFLRTRAMRTLLHQGSRYIAERDANLEALRLARVSSDPIPAPQR